MSLDVYLGHVHDISINSVFSFKTCSRKVVYFSVSVSFRCSVSVRCVRQYPAPQASWSYYKYTHTLTRSLTHSHTQTVWSYLDSPENIQERCTQKAVPALSSSLQPSPHKTTNKQENKEEGV